MFVLSRQRRKVNQTCNLMFWRFQEAFRKFWVWRFIVLAFLTNPFHGRGFIKRFLIKCIEVIFVPYF